MGVTSFVLCNEGGRNQGDQDVYIQAAEHGGAVHSYSTHYRLIPGYREEAKIAENNEMVVEGGPGIPRESSRGGGGLIQSRIQRGRWGQGREGSISGKVCKCKENRKY